VRTLEQSLADLLVHDQITYATAEAHANDLRRSIGTFRRPRWANPNLIYSSCR
jgi:Tfp pilus assembly ATPase PilU